MCVEGQRLAVALRSDLSSSTMQEASKSREVETLEDELEEIRTEVSLK